MRRFLTWFAVLGVLLCPVQAKDTPYDGLKVLGIGTALTDLQSDASMTLGGFHTKYDDALVGIYITQRGKQVRFYMNAATWDNLKQKLIQARDQWETISPQAFESFGQVRGYRVGDRIGTLSVSLQGATQLDRQRLNFALADQQTEARRVSISLTQKQVSTLVEQLYKVDEFLRDGK